MNQSNVDKTYTDPKTGKFVKGNTGGGRPLGSKNWRTVFNEAMQKIADANDKTPEEMEIILQEVGINRALKGDHRFWNEFQKRSYGDVTKEVHITADDKPSEKLQAIADALNEE